MAASQPSMECDQCGAQMDQQDSWSSKSPPLIGTTVEYTEYTCPECGNGALFKRKSDEDWQPA